MKISSEGIEITKRFFEAIDVLKAHKEIRGLQTFTRIYDIHRWNMRVVKLHPETSVLKPEWIAYLVRDFGISAEWIILGKGEMFKTKYVQKASLVKNRSNTIDSESKK